jgi:hypothetical protein
VAAACDDHGVAEGPNVFTDAHSWERSSVRGAPLAPGEDPADRLRLLFERAAATEEELPR